jgi:hypothetical protein
MPSNLNIGSWPERWNVLGKRNWSPTNSWRRSIIGFSSRSHAAFRKTSGRRFATWRRIFPRVFVASTTTATDRKEIIRQVVERVIVDVEESLERVDVRIEWIGGSHTEGVVIRPVGKLSELSTYPQICHQVQVLTEAGWTAIAIAQALSDAGFRPPRSTTGFRAETITQLQRQLGVRAPRPRVRHHDGLLPDE